MATTFCDENGMCFSLSSIHRKKKKLHLSIIHNMGFKQLSCTLILRTLQGDRTSPRESVTCSHLPLQHPKGTPGNKLHLQRLALQQPPKNHKIKHHIYMQRTYRYKGIKQCRTRDMMRGVNERVGLKGKQISRKLGRTQKEKNASGQSSAK